jgi:hypothetical protein
VDKGYRMSLGARARLPLAEATHHAPQSTLARCAALAPYNMDTMARS